MSDPRAAASLATFTSRPGKKTRSTWRQLSSWSSFTSGSAERAYLFDPFYLRFGLVQGKLKHIYDARNGRSQIHDFASDPLEQHDVVADAAYSGWAREAHRRIAAWSAFENNYLSRVGGRGAPIAGASREVSHDQRSGPRG